MVSAPLKPYMHALCMATIWAIQCEYNVHRQNISIFVSHPARKFAPLHSTQMVFTHTNARARIYKQLIHMDSIKTGVFHLQEVHVIFTLELGIRLLCHFHPKEREQSIQWASALYVSLTGTRSSHKYIIINYNETTLCEKLNCF